MSVKIKWLEVPREVYAEIYAAFRGHLAVHGTITRLEDDWHGDQLIMTEWGLPFADYPIIKHEQFGEPTQHKFYLAAVQNSDEE